MKIIYKLTIDTNAFDILFVDNIILVLLAQSLACPIYCVLFYHLNCFYLKSILFKSDVWWYLNLNMVFDEELISKWFINFDHFFFKFYNSIYRSIGIDKLNIVQK